MKMREQIGDETVGQQGKETDREQGGGKEVFIGRRRQ
jgi:hypothetical protein